MKAFIDHIVDHFVEAGVDAFKDQAVVFPTRRACYYFKETLTTRLSKTTFWIPEIYSIEDFIIACTGKPISNEIDLLFILYQAYRNTYTTPPKGEVDVEELPTFDKFYAFGQVLLKDFDEVDRYLVNADELYRNLEQLRDLEVRYQDNEEILEALKRFNNVIGTDPTALITNFSNQWSRVCKTYHTFKQALVQENLNYSGMLYRHLAEQLKNGTKEVPFSQVTFAGFNALSTSEEEIIQGLLSKDVATVFWDADRLYLDHEVEEAGRFMRRNYKKWPPSPRVNWIITDMAKGSKDIKLIGGVQSVGQSQVVGKLLEGLSQEQQEKCGVVLADEGLLFPVLHALPNNIERLNVTMGYPAKHSQWYRLVRAFLEYQLNQKGRSSKVYVDKSGLQDLLEHPLIRRAIPTVGHLLTRIPLKSRWVPISAFMPDDGSETIKLALEPKDRVSEIMDALVNLLMNIYQKLRVENQLDPLETEFAYHCIKQLMQLEERILKYQHQLELRTLVRLVEQAIEQVRIPFTGEPTEGLQLMGFLETRALDFESVILVSVNEGRIPRANQHTTYIPYAMRKAFRLPTFEEQDAVYAYHFKRILQRAKSVTVIYNTEVAIDGSGEKSRFTWQLKELFPKESIMEGTYQMSLTKKTVSTALEITKDQKVLELMGRFLIDNETKKSLSPTAIRHYLDCSLRFYFRYVVRLREREEESTELDARDFGNVVHQVLDKLYQPLEGKMVTKDIIQELLGARKIEEVVTSTINEHYKRSTESIQQGKDILHTQIIQKLIFKAIRNDLSQVPFTLVGTEMKIASAIDLASGHSLKLEGTLDRVHEKNGVHHIVDYKTGRADLVYLRRPAFPNNGEDYIQKHFDIPRYKSGFQGLFYGLLWTKVNGPEPVKLGVYPLKKVNEGIRYLNYGQVIPQAGIEGFGSLLKDTLEEIFDPEVAFTQTQDAERCRWCAYKEICQR